MKTLASLFLCAVVSTRVYAAPLPPLNVAATDGTDPDKVRITWKAAASATSYEVWRGTANASSSASKLVTKTSLSHDDTTAVPGTTYYYWVKARNNSGASGFSASNIGFRTAIELKENGSAYGYDQYTDPAHPWKSLETGKTDTVRVVITPSAGYATVSFASASSSSVSVSPATATSSSQVVSNQGGTSRGTARINARVAGTNKTYYSGAVYRKIAKTVAVTLVNEQDTDGKGPDRGYTSTNIADSLIIADLKKVYKQAVIEWTVVRQPVCTVNFDLNNDGLIDVNSWMSAEMQKIRDTCGSNHMYNIFLVNKPSDGTTGFMAKNQKYGFVHADGGGSQTVAHELGHGAAGLGHTPSDAANVMYNFYSPTAWRLRKNQWDSSNP